jgi:hypothetical protein
MHQLRSGLLLSCVLLAGCGWLNRDKQTAKPAVAANGGPPQAAELVSYLNREADRLATIESDDVDLTATVQDSGGRQNRLPGLRCFLVCEKPRSFRLTGDAVGTNYVDIGSNNDQFWFWVKDGDKPPLYYCSYADYERGVKLPLPFQPEWVVQALGMAKYDPNKNYKVEAKGNTYELSEEAMVQGTLVRKITIFNGAKRPNESTPVVMGHVIQDAQTGQVICQATIRRVRSAGYRARQGEGTVNYPSDVLLEWPAEKMSMTLKIGKATVNQPIPSDKLATYFARPDWPNLIKIDIAHYQPGGAPTSRTIEQAGGYR